MVDELLVYGSYGYTGDLVVREALDRGLAPVLAGRDAEAVEAQATERGLDHRVFSLEHPSVVEARLEDADASAVLNCAGPFTGTAAPLREACLRTGTDYLDVAGRVGVLEAAAERDREAERAGVTLLPGVGFDVVPTDCLAVHLGAQVDDAARLALGVDGLGTYSAGTLKSVIEGLDRPGAVREDGVIRDVPVAWKARDIDFGEGPKPSVTVPWGDVSTAYYSTGIPNVEVYASVPRRTVPLLRRSRPLVPLLGTAPAQWALKRLAEALPAGPSAARRARSSARVWGEVEGEGGDRAVARLRTPDTYDLTARTAVEAARRVVAGEVGDGFQTPATAFGPEFVLEFDGVEREAVSAAGDPSRPASGETDPPNRQR